MSELAHPIISVLRRSKVIKDVSPSRSERSHEPKINKFFSGKRFPFATLSNMDDQMFFLGPSLLDGRLFDRVSDVDMIRLFDLNVSARADHSNTTIYLPKALGKNDA